MIEFIIRPVKAEGQAVECILRRSLMFCSYGDDTLADKEEENNYSTSRGVRTWRILCRAVVLAC